VLIHDRGGGDRGASENVKIPAFSGHRTLVVWSAVLDCLGCRTDLQLPPTDGTEGMQKWLRGVMESAVGEQCVFCVDLRTNNDYFPIQLTGFYNRDGVCLLRGTDWVFRCFIMTWKLAIK
jgi:hypothetical protein